ncbi:MAG: metallophosphoesterase family protein [candidate division WOR-3 bacterium]
MKFVHIADTHIGCSQMGLPEREEDFREAFSEIVEMTLELAPQALVHAGDLFERPRPSNKDILFVAEKLLRLMKAGIEVLLVTGNHDKRSVRGEVAPQGIFELLGAKVFSVAENRMRYTVDGVEFWGLPYMTRKDELLRYISDMGEKARRPAILVLHQYAYPPTSLIPCLYPQDIPPVFSYGAFGHWHIPWIGERYAFPGASEARELSVEEANIKARCIYLIEVDDAGVRVEPHFLTRTRPFFYLDCWEDELLEKLSGIGEKLGSLAKKPMLRIKLRGGPDMRADQVVDNALKALGLKRGDFLLVNVKPERSERAPAGTPAGDEQTSQDIIGRFFGDDPQLLGLVMAMREAVIQAEAERELSGTQAKRDRQFLIDAAKEAAKKHLEENSNASV